MKLSKRTIDILKNFSNLSPFLVFHPGNVLATVTNSETVIARAYIEEVFEDDFGIYDLKKFLSTIELLEDPELTFTSSQVVMTSGPKSIEYRFSDLSLFHIEKNRVDPYKKKDNILPSIDIELTISYDDFKAIKKAADVLRLPQIVISGEGGKMLMGSADSTDVSGDKFSINLGNTNKNFNLIFRKENLQLIECEEYKIQASSQGLCLFAGKDVEYYCAIEEDSVFDAV